MTATDHRLGGHLVEAAIATVAYAAIFDHAVTLHEVHRYLPTVASPAEVADTLDRAVADGAIVHVEGHYVLPGREATVAQRAAHAATSEELRRRALPWVERVAAIPTVRMVAITGSLAVDNATPDADVDLLVVTVDDRLWVTRGLIVALTRLARRHAIELCPNFLLAESNLELDDRDHIAARELLQAVPVSGHDVYVELLDRNRWYRNFLPNAEPRPRPADPRVSNRRGWRHLVLRSAVGRLVDRIEMRRQLHKLASTTDRAEVAFGPRICKAHVDGHKHRITEEYKAILTELGSRTGT
jgi:predicted nucleotidyltransferase